MEYLLKLRGDAKRIYIWRRLCNTRDDTITLKMAESRYIAMVQLTSLSLFGECVLCNIFSWVIAQLLFIIWIIVTTSCSWGRLLRRVWRYQRGNQNPYIEDVQTTQWPKEKVQKDKQRSTKYTHKTNCRVTRT